MTAEVNPVSSTTTIKPSPDWRKYIFFLTGILLAFTGFITVIICSYNRFTWSPHTEDNSSEEEEPSDWWLVLGIIFLFFGIMMLLVCWKSHGSMSVPAASHVEPKMGRIERDSEKSLPVNNKREDNFRINELNSGKTQSQIDSPVVPHYKPRNFNQHGYGNHHAPIATIDEFDYSLRSSMNSLWSQHIHQQINQSSEESEDGSSFQSIIMQ
ncbi:unnamed protein product [Allacma fusca]|uniref:Uncharacterized protein n=1 Tax=Allacma fusca TaxID=39272 RepID=A0A8J2P998_9HEXA|nr:unnamed protein product [Allacma fusca]